MKCSSCNYKKFIPIEQNSIFKIIFILQLLFFTSQICYSQNIHPSLLSVELTLKNFPGNGKLDAGLSINYLKEISIKLDCQVSFSGMFSDSVSKNSHKADKQSFIFQNDFNLRYRFLNNPMFKFQPYIRGGIGYSVFRGNLGGYLPLGGGIQLHFNQIYFLLQSHYNISIHPKINSHLHIGFGIAGSLSNPKRKAHNKVIPASASKQISDTDNDGIYDNVDACPTIPGIIKFNGCPDSDNDGIQDIDDKCPSQFGLERYQGCPVPDTDNDGINDEEDQCIQIPGIREYRGCPIPDTDGDGITDLLDECVTVKGPINNKGCPLDSKTVQNSLNDLSKAIYFKTGSAQLLTASFPPLDSILSILNNNPEIHLRIEGHTDNVGMETYNIKLSQDRAKAVLDYLTRHNISSKRLISKGYGSKQPIADNKTLDGRAENRRVELISLKRAP